MLTNFQWFSLITILLATYAGGFFRRTFIESEDDRDVYGFRGGISMRLSPTTYTSVGWIQEDPLTANILITAVYASVSFVRSYFYRRIFEKFGIDDNFIRLGIKGFRKLRNLPSNLFR